MSERQNLSKVLRETTDPDVAAAIESLIDTGHDRDLVRINVPDFAKTRGLPLDAAIAGFLHAARLGVFELSWNVLCQGCGGVLKAGAKLKSIDKSAYDCTLCAAGYQVSLDEMVEVTFTISPRIRRIAAHEPETLPIWDYYQQIFWSSGVDLPANYEALINEITLDSIELAAGERAVLSLQLPAQFVIIFDPVTHATQFLDIKGEPTTTRQNVSLMFNELHAPTGTTTLQPGPLRLSLENRTGSRVLPTVWVAGDTLHDLLGRRRPILTARGLLTNQTFRDLYRTDTLDVDQGLKILSLSFLFTDLKSSTALYERVGDLKAYDLVRLHFDVLQEIVARNSGAVVKTIGDAVMATFSAPDHALAAALNIRDAVAGLADGRLAIKIGIHEGPCLAVNLNDRLDYFGQTVNIAARVQNLAQSQAICVTNSIMRDADARQLLVDRGLVASEHQTGLRGISEELQIYTINPAGNPARNPAGL